MSKFFKSRLFKIISVSCLSLLLCFTFMFTSLNNNKHKASASELVSPNTVLALPIVILSPVTYPNDLYISSFYLSYDLSDNVAETKHKYRLFYPYANYDITTQTTILDYNTRAWSSSSKGNVFSINQIGAFEFASYNSNTFRVIPFGDVIYFDITTYQSIDYIVNDSSAYVTFQRYNVTTDGIKYGYVDLTIYGGDGSIYVNLKYYTNIAHRYVDSAPKYYSKVVAFTATLDDVSSLIERAYQSGYNAGVASGAGYESGYNAGYNIGYNDGYNYALGIGGGSSGGSSGGILDPILNSVDSFMDLNIFGNFGIGDLLSLVFGFILIGLFIKLFLGG